MPKIGKEEYDQYLCELKIPPYLSMVDKYGYFPYEKKKSSGFSYKFYRLPIYEHLRSEYGLPQIAGNGGTIEKALNIMDFLTRHTFYNGMAESWPTTTEFILSISFDKGFAGAINCANKAILLSDFLLAVNIFSIPVCLNGNDGSNGSNHWVAQIYIPELNKWIMLDPSFNCCITDADDKILNIDEIHKAYKRNQTLKIKNYLFNGDTEIFKDKYFLCFLMPTIFEISAQFDNLPFISKDPFTEPEWKPVITIIPSDYENNERFPNHVSYSYCDIFDMPKWEK